MQNKNLLFNVICPLSLSKRGFLEGQATCPLLMKICSDNLHLFR